MNCAYCGQRPGESHLEGCPEPLRIGVMDEDNKQIGVSVGDVELDNPLNCFKCNRELAPAVPESSNKYQPYGGTMFSAGSGHYGSTVWDDYKHSRRQLCVNICDPCLREFADRTIIQSTYVQPPTRIFTKWEPEPTEYPDDTL